MTKTKIGVLVMSYGTPQNMDQIEAYYTHIRRGQPPTPEQLKQLTKRYEAIVGGVFPMRENTNLQVNKLQDTLNLLDPSNDYVCYQGLKHAAPFIEDGVRQMVRDGMERAVGVVLAPHYSIMSVGDYAKRAEQTADEAGISLTVVKNYHMHPLLLEAWTERVREGLGLFACPPSEVRLLFSAHSLPARIVEMKDPYPEQLLETAGEVARMAGHANWQFAWQSAGRTAVPWLGPDILDVMRQMNEREQVRHVLVGPIGFVSDHLEILYDIDIECKQLAEQLGMQLERTRSLGADPRYIGALADVVIHGSKHGSKHGS